MKKTSAFFLVAAAASLLEAEAAISVVGNNLGGSGRQFVDSTGTLLPDGNAVRVGFFNDVSANIHIISGNDFNSINALFRPLAEGAAGAGTVTTGSLATRTQGTSSGRLTYVIDGVTQSYLPAGTQLYVWVFNNANPAAATQWAIFTNNDDSPWVAAVDNPDVPGSGDLSLPIQNSIIDDADDVLKGSLSAGQVRLAPVPEPGMAALCLAALTLAVRRRREA